MARSKRFVPILTEIVAALTVTAAYLSTSKDYGSVEVFFKHEVEAYSFESSQLDVWIFSLVKALIMVLIGHKLGFCSLSTLVVGSLVYLTVKACFLSFEFTAQYLCQVFAVLSVVAEILLYYKWVGVQGADDDGADEFTKAKTNGGYSRLGKNDIESGQLLHPNATRNYRSFSNASHAGGRKRAGTIESDSEYVSAEEDSDEDDEFKKSQANVKHINKLRPLSDWALNETEQELPLVAAMKKQFPLVPEERLLRFLRARELNLANAIKMCEQNLQYRADKNLNSLDFSRHMPQALRGYDFPDTNGCDSPGQWDMERLNFYSGSACHKWTLNGTPLVVFPLGSSDAKGVGQNITKEVLEGTIIAGCEMIGNILLPDIETKVGKITPTISLIFDVEGLGIRQFYMPALLLFQGLLQKIEDNYPESLQVVMIINAPSIFQMFWTVIKPFLPVRTLGKIQIYGYDYKAYMHERVAPENMPWFWGGLCSCRHEGGCVPYPLSKGYTDPHKDQEGYYMSGKVQPNAFHDHPIAITKYELERYQRLYGESAMPLGWSSKVVQGQFARFELMYMPDYDLHYKEKPDKLTSIKSQVIKLGQVISDEVTVDKAGTYFLRWTNTGTSAIDVRFKLKMLPDPPRPHHHAKPAKQPTPVNATVQSINGD